MARLLAAERKVPFEHFLHHVFVADGAAYQSDPERAERQLEPDVAHDRGHDRVALEPPFALQLPAAHQQHGVAIHDFPVVIDEDRAIAVAVERDAHPASMLDDRAREPLRMGRAAAQVDVAAIGLIADHLDVEAEAAEEGRGDRRRGAVRAVDRELEA